MSRSADHSLGPPPRGPPAVPTLWQARRLMPSPGRPLWIPTVFWGGLFQKKRESPKNRWPEPLPDGASGAGPGPASGEHHDPYSCAKLWQCCCGGVVRGGPVLLQVSLLRNLRGALWPRVPAGEYAAWQPPGFRRFTRPARPRLDADPITAPSHCREIKFSLVLWLLGGRGAVASVYSSARP